MYVLGLSIKNSFSSNREKTETILQAQLTILITIFKILIHQVVFTQLRERERDPYGGGKLNYLPFFPKLNIN